MALTPKQQVFVQEYLMTWNATEAARRAEYANPGQQGHRLLKNIEISGEIQLRIADKAMTADEVLTRLAEHARGDMSEYIRFDAQGTPFFDLHVAAQAGKLNLAKKLKVRTRSWKEPYYDPTIKDIKQRDVIETSIEFELYDAQSALVHIGKHHGIFTDRVDVNHSGEVTTKIIEGPKDVR